MNVFIYLYGKIKKNDFFVWKKLGHCVLCTEQQMNRQVSRQNTTEGEKQNKNNNNKVSVRESEKYLTFFMYVM